VKDMSEKSMDLSVAVRHEFYKSNYDSLEKKAYRAIHVLKFKPEEVALVAIDVDDPDWRQFADHLMPGEDWDKTRAQGLKPVARGTVTNDIVEYIKTVCPDIAEGVSQPPNEGFLYCFVMAAGGVAVYEVPYHMPPVVAGHA